MRPKARASINEQSKLQLFCCLCCPLGANLSFPRVIPNSNYGRESNSKEKGGRIERMERLVAGRFKRRTSTVESSVYKLYGRSACDSDFELEVCNGRPSWIRLSRDRQEANADLPWTEHESESSVQSVQSL